MIIPDLNILLYLVNKDAAYHTAAQKWLEQAAQPGQPQIGLPWVVSLGFLRLTTNPKIFASPLTVDQAFSWLQEFRQTLASRDLNPSQAHLGILRVLLAASGTGGNLTADAHLAALALETNDQCPTPLITSHSPLPHLNPSRTGPFWTLPCSGGRVCPGPTSA